MQPERVGGAAGARAGVRERRLVAPRHREVARQQPPVCVRQPHARQIGRERQRRGGHQRQGRPPRERGRRGADHHHGDERQGHLRDRQEERGGDVGGRGQQVPVAEAADLLEVAEPDGRPAGDRGDGDEPCPAEHGDREQHGELAEQHVLATEAADEAVAQRVGGVVGRDRLAREPEHRERQRRRRRLEAARDGEVPAAGVGAEALARLDQRQAFGDVLSVAVDREDRDDAGQQHERERGTAVEQGRRLVEERPPSRRAGAAEGRRRRRSCRGCWLPW